MSIGASSLTDLSVANDQWNSYYEKLAPLTPVVLPDYRKPAAHLTLLTEEPLLAIAILLIASRYAKLKGPAHASRPINIQNVLWSHLRGMVERLLWGQEQFGGGFCGGGAVKLQEAKTGQINWKGSLRTLGTVEALLLMTEWQPRALHFPPGDDDDKLIHSRLASLDGGEADDQMEQSGQAPAFSHWLEPQWRSDRMSWMLLGLAQSLAFELGVFDASVEQGSDSSSECEVARKIRLRRLVLLYVSQTSGRLGITSPLSLSEYSHEFVLGTKDDNPIDVMQKLWLHIASIMNKANVEIFPSREVTRDLTTSGRYAAKVDEFWPLLKEWRKRYDQNRDKSKLIACCQVCTNWLQLTRRCNSFYSWNTSTLGFTSTLLAFKQWLASSRGSKASSLTLLRPQHC